MKALGSPWYQLFLYFTIFIANYHEATALEKAHSSGSEVSVSATDTELSALNKIPNKARSEHFDRKITYSEHTGLVASHSVGDWSYFPETHALAFDGEILPYVFFLSNITTSGKFLDCILQLSKKRWPRSTVEERNISPTYQVHEFIDLINDLCHAYLGISVQGAFSPSGKTRVVNWEAAIEQQGEEALAAHVAAKSFNYQQFGI